MGLVLIAISYSPNGNAVDEKQVDAEYWFKLHRKSNVEYLYLGRPGDINGSLRVRTFKVKVGTSGERPTPLPNLLGRDYWLITKKEDSSLNPETAPFFLTLDIPVSDTEPFGPEPYTECDGQCNWVLPGAFGLHGVNGNLSKLSDADLGSSGCIRHTDSDITFLYNLLDVSGGGVKYYIEDV